MQWKQWAGSVFKDIRFPLFGAVFLFGYMYESIFLCNHSNPFISGNQVYTEFGIMLLSVPLIYLFSAQYTLYPFSEKKSVAVCWNILLCLLPFIMGLHWNFLEHVFPSLNYSLTPHDFQRMTPHARVTYAFLALFFVGIFMYHIYLAYKRRIVGWYLAAFAVIILTITLITLILGKHYYIHIHHYFLFGLLIPFARFRTVISAFSMSFCCGVYIEGACRYGMDPVWYPTGIL